MPDPITDDVLDLFADTLIAQPGNTDEFGDFAASGAALNVPAHIEGEAMLLRDITGREVVSSVQVHVVFPTDLVEAWIATGWDGWIDPDWIGADDPPTVFTPTGYRFTLPSRYSPRDNIKAISVVRENDENGPHHEVIYLP